MAFRRTVALLVAAVGLLSERPAAADWVSADLALAPSATANRMTTTLTATLLGQTRQDTQISTISGNVLVDLGISFDPRTAEPIGTRTIAFAGGRVSISDTAFRLSWGLVGALNISATGVQGTVDTPAPPGLVSEGSFDAAEHRLILDQGILVASGTGLIGGMLPPELDQVNLAQTPMAGPGSGAGTITISSPTLGQGTASYWIDLRLPVSYDQMVYEDASVGTMRAAGSGLIEARGQIVRLIPAWEADGSGDWAAQANWQGGHVPDMPGATARLLGTVALPAVVTLDGVRTVGTILFDSGGTYTIASGSGGILSLDNHGTGAAIVVADGHHRIEALVRAADAATFDIADGAALELAGGLEVLDGSAIRKTGAGVIHIQKGAHLGMDASLHSQDGALHLDQVIGGSLQASGAGVVIIEPRALEQVSMVRSIALAGDMDAWEGRLDLRGALLVLADPEAAQDAFARIVNQVKSARNGPSPWMGPGIGSGTAAANPLMAVAVVLHEEGILLQPALLGDADLNGTIDGDDYYRLDQGFLTGAAGWEAGDFDYSGVIDAGDYFLIDRSHLAEAGGPASLEVRSVPEPSAALAAGLVLAVACITRRRSAVIDRSHGRITTS